ncbi:MAG: ADOP family duplicated permease [Vicinamibacterales bacterium]
MPIAAPPRSAQALLQRVLPAEDAEVIAGDLEETFRERVLPCEGIACARRWYWRQVISIVWARMFDASVHPTEQSTSRPTMDSALQDLFYAARSLRKQPGYTAIAILLLALGTGAAVAVLSLTYAVLFKPLPYRDPARLMMVHMLAPMPDADISRPTFWSYPKYRAFHDAQQLFDSTAVFGSAVWNVTGSDAPEQLNGELVEGTYFKVLGVSSQVGRFFDARETESPHSAPLALLSYGVWMRRFGGDPNVIGRTLGLNGIPHTILGVMPLGFRGLTGQADVWVPITTVSADDLGNPWDHSYYVVARRKSSVATEEVQATMPVIGKQVDELFADRSPTGKRWSATAAPLNEERAGGLIRRSILVLLAAVAVVLLIVCINLANLTLVRGLARQRDVAIRLALGASRFRIVRQLMTESLLIAVLGALGGLGVASLATVAAGTVLPDLRMVLPRDHTAGLTRVGLDLIHLDASVLVLTGVVAAGAATLFGLGPAWRASRRDLTTTLKPGSSGSVASSARWFGVRNLMAASEMALALVLLTASGLMLKSVMHLYQTELGFQPRSLMTFRVALLQPRYDSDRATRFLGQLVTQLRAHGETATAAFGSCAPVSGGCNRTSATFPGRPPATGPRLTVGVLWISPGYFETLGISVMRGRTFADTDRAGQPKVVVINETAARTFWNGEDPIGKRIAIGQGGFGDGAEVVGVVADVRYASVEQPVGADVYLPLVQSRRPLGFLFVRNRGAVEPVVSTVMSEVRSLDSDLPLTDIKLMDERVSDATWRTRMGAWLLSLFGAMALVLAALGVYGVISQGVEQRTREIGVRMALGADRSHILRMVVGRVCAIALAGIAIGLVITVPSMRLLSALLYEVKPADPTVLTALALILLSVTLVAGYLPARRAARVDPIATLRAE